jgi:hypothetical protein
MTKEELEKEAAAYAKKHRMLSYCGPTDIYVSDEEEIINAILFFAELREKRISELEAYNEKLLNGDIEKHNKIMELEAELAKRVEENAELKRIVKMVAMIKKGIYTEEGIKAIYAEAEQFLMDKTIEQNFALKTQIEKMTDTETMLKILKDRGVIRSWYYNGTYHVGNELPK